MIVLLDFLGLHQNSTAAAGMFDFLGFAAASLVKPNDKVGQGRVAASATQGWI